MSTTLSMTSRRMSTMEHAAVAVGALLVGVLLSAVLSGVAVGWVGVWTAVTYPIAVYASSRILEDRRQATDRLVRVVVTLAFIVVVLPLASLVWTVIVEGAARFDTTFLSGNMRLTLDDIASQRTGGEVGGAFHAMIGTLIVTAVSTVIAIPLGLFTAIYLVEYGRGRLAKAITSMVDVMTGIPSIVAGLFAYALFVLILGPGTRTGLAGGVALSVLMTPVVIRSAEEMLRLVPNELREASLALGVPRWKTISKVVLPTAIAGILTGATLAIARVIGETAPLLVTVGLAQETNLNPFDGRMTTLPVYTYYQYVQPGIPTEAGQNRAWAAALMLVIIVAVLFTLGRVLAKVLQPKGLR
jgi:phosphate transport system permease protein